MSQEIIKKFPESRRLPVIRLQSNTQAVEQAGIAIGAGADGVFIIDHKKSTYEDHAILADAAREVMDAHPNLWVGVNCLTADAVGSLKFFGEDVGTDGVWSDNAVNWHSHLERTDIGNLERIRPYGGILDEHRQEIKAVLFGGLAMKGPGYIDDPFEAATFIEYAKGYVDVVTTSGPGTGIASPIERLRQIRLAMDLGEKLAVASGVDAHNIADQARYADYFLVASSIETKPMSGIFDPKKLRQLMGVYLEHDVDLSELERV